ncbi:MAG TPA: late competence development ComFB family protein [Rectinemataceae bacterium]|nr:late competence development ComFB family protein [Rectinemataceae bacterium]
MEIRNLAEESVLAEVDAMFTEEESGKKLGFCTCAQCRLDVACYVLNRIKPEYIVSSRGMAYSERDFMVTVQKRADILSLAREGWSHVAHRPRLTAEHGQKSRAATLPVGPAFNLPTIMGRVFNGLNFEPVAQGEVLLLLGGDDAPMADSNWQNPFVLSPGTAGTFIFWVCPLAASEVGEHRNFTFEVRSSVPGLDPVSHYFELAMTSEREAVGDFGKHGVHKLPDILLFPHSEEEEDS